MASKKPLMLGLVLAGFLAVAFWFGTRGSHPERLTYKGYSLEVWSQQAVQADTNAVAVLRELGARAVPGLVILLTHDESGFRRRIWSLQPQLPSLFRRVLRRHIRPPEAVGRREAAAFSLGIIGSEAQSAVPALVQALHEPDRRIAWRASKALGQIRKGSVPPLVATLNDSDAIVRQVAIYALGEIGPTAAEAANPLLQLLDDRDPTVRRTAYNSLMKIGIAVEPMLLQRIHQEQGEERQAPARLLLRYYEALDFGILSLLEMAQDSDPANRQAALKMLGHISAADGQAASTVIEALKDPSPQVRLAAIQAIPWGNWKTVSPVSSLTPCLTDDSATVREAATSVLAELSQPATNSTR